MSDSEKDIRERRKARIMSSREDRLAKIMSLGSGRKVDASEVKLTPPPMVSEPIPVERETIGSNRSRDALKTKRVSVESPTDSEKAAAGVGSLSGSSSADDQEDCVSSEESIVSSTSSEIQSKSAGPIRPVFHLFCLLITSLLVIMWLRYHNLMAMVQQQETLKTHSAPWHVLSTAFLAVEVVEWMAGRVALVDVPADVCLFLLPILICTRLEVF